jgi:alpha-ketoglutarate-dependent taurine dioxygenase
MDSGPRGAAGNVGLDFESHHPVVRTHPLTGWKSLFAWGVNCLSIDGVTDIESAKLLKKVTRLVLDNQDTQVRFHWEGPGDLGTLISGLYLFRFHPTT